MTNRTHLLRPAGTAIAAVLAIAATSSLAQDAAAPFPAAPEPVIVVPDIPVPAASPPTVVLPANPPATVQPLPEPSAQAAEPQPAAPAAAATRTRATAPAAPAVRTAPPPPAPVQSVTSESAPVENTAAVVPPVTVVEPAPVTSVASAAPDTTTTQATRSTGDNTGIIALVLGGLLFLALAIWGFIAIGRRKPVRRYAAEAVPAPVAPTAPAVARTVDTDTVEPAPVQRSATVDTLRRSPTVYGTGTSGALPHAGASVALPARVPQDYAERDALMQRMIAAKPDRANPFTDRSARTRRARLILQSLGRDFGGTEPWIDLSQYPNNWPELAHKRSAAA